MDNQSTQTENTQTQDVTQQTQPVQQAPAFSWKTQLAPDLAGAPSMKKFEDTKDGFNEAVKSHLLLEKLLGYEKVPIPKGKDDTAAWQIFSKAMGIPEKPDGYGLPEAEIPDSMKGLSFDKAKFAEVAHRYKLTPEAAKGLWGDYTEMTKQAYSKALKERQENLTNMVNQLRGEWGDAYPSKVELGQMVINKFSDNPETNDFITATLSQDPRGVKFLAKIADQFAENKIGEFRYQRHSVTPEEAEAEITALRRSPEYNSEDDKIRGLAIERMNTLIGIARRPRG